MKTRKQTIGLAYAATGGAKIAGALVQLAVLPIAAKALGADEFGLLFAVAALASFPLIAMAGFSPAASVLLAQARAGPNENRIGSYFWSLILFSIAGGVVLSVVTYFVLTGFNLPGAIDPNLVAMFLMFIIANFVAAPIDGTRAAFRQSHYNSAFAVAGSVVTLVMVVFADAGVGAAYYFAAIYLVPVAVQVANLILFIAQNPDVIGAPRLDRSVRKDVATLLLANVQAQGGIVIYLHGGVLMLANLFGTGAVAVVGAFVRIAILLHSALLALFSPVLPTLAEAVARGDRAWLAKGLKSLAIMAFVALSTQAIMTVFFGEWLARDLFGIASTHGGVFFAALALFLFCYSATHLLFVTRLMVMDSARKGNAVLTLAIVGIVTAFALAADSVTAFLAVQALSMTVVIVAYMYQLWQVGQASR